MREVGLGKDAEAKRRADHPARQFTLFQWEKMSIRNERVAAMVRDELSKNGQVENAVLLQKARGIDPKLRRLSARQFHGTYRLPALREAKRASRTASGTSGGGSASGSSNAGGAPGAEQSKKAAPSARQAPAAAPRRRRRRGNTESQQAPGNRAVVAAAQSNGDGNGKPSASTTSAPAASASSSAAQSRPRAADRETVRRMLQSVAREAMAVEDRASFIQLLDSLDERADAILGMAGRR